MDRALKGLFLFRPVRVCRKTDRPYFADGAGGMETRRFIILKAVEHRYGEKVAKARAEAAKVDTEGSPASFWGKESKKMYLKRLFVKWCW